MKSRRWLLSRAALLLVGIPGTLGRPTAEAQQSPSDKIQQYKSPWQKIDEQAKLENPADGNSVRALIDAILEYPHSYSLNLPVMREIVEQRLVQAEINFKLGRNQGIPEKSVVQIANTLADQLKLPAYAQVTLHQVEVLRFGMGLSMGSFMGDVVPHIEETGAHPDLSELSPAQAAHTLLVLIDQKIVNPDYQLTPEEWEKTQYQPAMDRLLKYKELRDSGESAKMKTHATVTALSISNDLRTQISSAVSQMSLTDGLDLANQVFEIAGLAK